MKLTGGPTIRIDQCHGSPVGVLETVPGNTSCLGNFNQQLKALINALVSCAAEPPKYTSTNNHSSRTIQQQHICHPVPSGSTRELRRIIPCPLFPISHLTSSARAEPDQHHDSPQTHAQHRRRHPQQQPPRRRSAHGPPALVPAPQPPPTKLLPALADPVLVGERVRRVADERAAGAATVERLHAAPDGRVARLRQRSLRPRVHRPVPRRGLGWESVRAEGGGVGWLWVFGVGGGVAEWGGEWW